MRHRFPCAAPPARKRRVFKFKLRVRLPFHVGLEGFAHQLSSLQRWQLLNGLFSPERAIFAPNNLAHASDAEDPRAAVVAAVTGRPGVLGSSPHCRS